MFVAVILTPQTYQVNIILDRPLMTENVVSD